jgi:hypothetical protein
MQVVNIKLALPGRMLDAYPSSRRESVHLNREWLAVQARFNLEFFLLFLCGCVFLWVVLRVTRFEHHRSIFLASFRSQDIDALGWASPSSSPQARAAAPHPAPVRRCDAASTTRVVWERGNMARTPLTWEEWGAPAYKGPMKEDWDARQQERDRTAKEAAAERATQVAAEAAARAAELHALRTARDEANLHASASDAAASAATAAAALQLTRMQAAYDSRIAAIEAQAAAAATAAAAGAAGSSGGAGSSAGSSLCIVCLDEPRRVALQPCGHYNFCKGCAEQVMRLGHARCPVCRSPVKVAQEIFV